MRTGVVYLNHGRSHLDRLVVSLHSLRQHYDGPVVLLDTKSWASGDVIREIERDKRLNVSVRSIKLHPEGRQPVFITKSYVWRHAGLDAALQIDADTIFECSPSGIIEKACESPSGFIVTPNRGHDTGYEYVQKRLSQWRRIIAPGLGIGDMLQLTSENRQPLINAGVLAWRSDSQFLPKWEQLTKAGWLCKFTDEVAAQLLMTREPHEVADRWWNTYPLDSEIDPTRVRIWHFHGSAHVREPGRNRWNSALREAMIANAAKIRDWASPSLGLALDGLSESRQVAAAAEASPAPADRDETGDSTSDFESPSDDSED